MDLFDAIAKRYSYRGAFTATLVPREHLEKIVQAGIQAPSGKNEQTTTFVVIDQARLLSDVADILDRPVCNTARAMIACVIDPREAVSGTSFVIEDCAAAVENMLLAITALGYASVWLDGVLRRDHLARQVGELLGVPPDKIVRVLLPIGVPRDPGQQNRRLAWGERAWFNRYGGA